ncbi:rod shape-determining protein RodA, partial [Rhodospirillales bacterium 47_12_T64]
MSQRVQYLGRHNPEITLGQKIWQLNWGMIVLICMIAAIGLGMLYSAANGNFDPWASRQAIRFGVGFVFMLVVALIDIRIW